MKNPWSVLALACSVFILTACATQAPQQSFEGNELADSWEAQYLDTYGYSGL